MAANQTGNGASATDDGSHAAHGSAQGADPPETQQKCFQTPLRRLEAFPWCHMTSAAVSETAPRLNAASHVASSFLSARRLFVF